MSLDCKSINAPSSISVFPAPNFPHTKDSSPGGNRTDTSIRENFLFGVDDTEVTPLLVPVFVDVAVPADLS
jgi:hypothetical protein